MRSFLIMAALLMALPASAHTVNVTYLDVQQKPEGIVLTAAFQPHQALVIAGLRHDDNDSNAGGFADLIPALKEQGDIIAAYAVTHVTMTTNDEECTWDPDRVDVPSTELNALADGVTVSGYVTCNTAPISELFMGTSLLFDAFPTSLIIVRLEYPDGFADKLTLTSSVPQGKVVLDTAPTIDRDPQQNTSRTATVAGWALLALVLISVGSVFYRMNIASPKE